MTDDKWENYSPMTREEFDEIVKQLRDAPYQPERFVIHVTKRLVDDFEATGLLTTLKNCQLVGSPEARAYAEERIKAVLEKK